MLCFPGWTFPWALCVGAELVKCKIQVIGSQPFSTCVWAWSCVVLECWWLKSNYFVLVWRCAGSQTREYHSLQSSLILFTKLCVSISWLLGALGFILSGSLGFFYKWGIYSFPTHVSAFSHSRATATERINWPDSGKSGFTGAGRTLDCRWHQMLVYVS